MFRNKTKLMKQLLFLLLAISTTTVMAQDNFHQFKANTLDGGELDFSTLKGMRVKTSRQTIALNPTT